MRKKKQKDLKRHWIARLSSDPLSREDECVAVRAAQNGCEHARDTLMRANARFVIDCVFKLQPFAAYEDQEDLIAVGMVGLLRALQTYDASRGHKFITYAVWWIRNEVMVYAMRNANGAVALPVATYRKSVVVQEEAIEDDPVVSPMTATYVTTPPLSLSLKAGQHSTGRDKNSIQDTLPDAASLPDEIALDRARAAVVGERIEALLPPREASIIRAYFLEQKTLEEVGQDRQITRERVRQLRNRAMAVLAEDPTIQAWGRELVA